MKKLSKRLMAVVNFVKKGSIVLDVGTDHALIPMHLVEEKISPKAVASDIVDSICKNAAKEIKNRKLEDQIEVIKSDGLKDIKRKDVDTIIIAGMGGLLICDILNARKKYVEDKTLILSPHRDSDKVRRYLHKIGFKITKEDIVKDKPGKFYFIIEAKKGTDTKYSDIDYLLGKKLIKKVKEKEDFKEYLDFECNKIEKNIQKISKSKAAQDKIKELKKIKTEYMKIYMKG